MAHIGHPAPSCSSPPLPVLHSSSLLFGMLWEACRRIEQLGEPDLEWGRRNAHTNVDFSEKERSTPSNTETEPERKSRLHDCRALCLVQHQLRPLQPDLSPQCAGVPVTGLTLVPYVTIRKARLPQPVQYCTQPCRAADRSQL